MIRPSEIIAGPAFRRSVPKQVIVLLALLLTCLAFIPFSPWMPRAGLDPSWCYAINEAVERGLVFGRDLIFTFGPMGSVYSTAYGPGTDFQMLWGSALYVIGFAIAVHLSAPVNRQWWAVLLPILLCLLFSRDVLFLVLPVFLLLAVTRVTAHPSSRYYLRATPGVVLALAVATYAMGLGPLVKGSFSGVVLPVGGLTFLMLWSFRKKAGLGFSAVLLFSICLNWIAAGQGLKDLPQFFLAQGPIISGYTNAMSQGGSVDAVVYILLASALVLVLFSHALLRAFGSRAWMPVVGMAFTLFVAFKAGFVRQDGHVLVSIGVLLMLSYGISLYANTIVVLATWCATVTAWCLIAPSNFDRTPRFVWNEVAAHWGNTISGIHQRIAHPERFFEQYEKAKEKIRLEHPLPLTTGTVDLYPTELSTIFAHDLNWSGRPIPQSYSVYETSLDNKNVAHLRSADAPETVLFSFSPIDGRLPAIEDAGSVLELLGGYMVSAIESPYLVLKKRTNGRGASLDVAHQKAVLGEFGKAIELDSTRPIWMQADIQPTLLGKLVAGVFRLPQIQIELTFDNGAVIRRRVIPKITSAGFIVAPYLAVAEDFAALAAGVDLGVKVKSVRFFSEQKYLWKDDFDVRLTPIDVVPQKAARDQLFKQAADSSDLPLEGVPQKSAQCVVDDVNGRSMSPGTRVRTVDGLMRLRGWTAPVGGEDRQPIQAWIIVQSADGRERYFKAGTEKRPDVAAHFKRPGLMTSGFDLGMDISDLPGPKRLYIKSVSGGEVYTCPIIMMIDD